VGRAGRDGQPAIGLLLFAAADFPRRRHLIETGSDGAAPSEAIVEHKWNLFLELMRWAEGGSCRHDAILRYFGDDEETLAGCGICDVCRTLDDGDADDRDPEAVTLIVRKALSGVARTHGRFGLTAAVQLLRGSADERLGRTGLDRTPTFGILREHPEEWLQRLVRRFVTAGWVDFEGGDRPVGVLTEAGRAVMRGDRPARVVLPPARSPRPATAGGSTRRRRAAPLGTEAELSPDDLSLVDALREYRLDVSRAENVPPYVVAHDRTLRDIARLKPRSSDSLLEAHGMGPAKVKRYGAGLLDVVRQFLASH